MEIVWKIENGPCLMTPTVHKDERGYFYESYNDKEFKEKVADVTFVQDNQSCSSYGVFRGMHFQKPPYAQAKLVRVIKGAVVDIVLDIRKSSPEYGKFYMVYLSEENKREFYVPRGFAHGFVSLSDDTIFQYKCDNFYNKESEGGLKIMTPQSNPLEAWISFKEMQFSEKDLLHPTIEDFETPFE